MDIPPNIYRELGDHTARLKVLEASQEGMNEKLDILLERSAQERGSRASLWKVGTASGGGGALLVAVMQWLSDLRGPH